MRDLRYALRTLRARPLFTLVAVLTLTLGIGGNAAIFAVFYQALLRPLPYRDPDRLVFVWNTSKNGGHTHVSIPDYLDRRNEAPAIEDATLMAPGNATLATDGPPDQVPSLRVTTSFFSTLGRGPMLGRPFTPDDARVGMDRVVMLTFRLWQSRFAGDPTVVGRTLRVNGEDRVIVGVMPSDFEVPIRNAELLMPFAFTPAQMSDQERGNEFSRMIARLRPDASATQLNAQMRTIVNRLIERLPARGPIMRNSGFTGVAVPVRDELVGEARTPLYLLQAGVLIVLLIACANVANLLLMRASGRSRELVIRTSLGATRWHIVRQLTAEGAVLATLGAAGGIAVAAIAVRVLTRMLADQVPSATVASIGPVVLAFTAVITIAAGLLFGVVPAVSTTRRDGSDALKDARSTPGRAAGRLRSLLVVAETAFAVMLLVAAGLLVTSLSRVLDVHPGFSVERVLSAQVSLPAIRYPDATALRSFWPRLLERAAALPGATSVAITGAVPFGGVDGSGTYRLLDRPIGPADQLPHAFLQTIGGDYFKTLEIPLLEGRLFNDGDTATAPRVVIVDEFLAKRQFAGRSPIGQQLNFGSPRNYTIVGIVGTINGGDPARQVAEERIYFTVLQVPQSTMSVLIKSAATTASLVQPLRAAVQSLDPEQAISEVRTLDERLARALQPRRVPAVLFMIFGIVALTLSAIGVYGVLSFGVTERVREFGIRQALGADRRSILSLVLRQGLRSTAIGLVAGTIGAAALTRYLQSLLFQVSGHDPVIFTAVIVILFAVAVGACCMPARRAMRLDPAVALRET